MRFGAIVPAGMAVAGNAGIAFVHDGDHMGDWGEGWWIAMVLLMVLFLAAVIFLIVWATRSFAGSREQPHRTPLDIARERLARGEISEEEFERIRRHLS